MAGLISTLNPGLVLIDVGGRRSSKEERAWLTWEVISRLRRRHGAKMDTG